MSTTAATRTQATSATRSVSLATAVYTGPYNVLGQKHGMGEMVWSNGDCYRGEFVADQRQGQGTLTFASRSSHMDDGGEYVGQWHHNQMHGDGTRRYPNGDVYNGSFQHNERHGQGRFYYSNGDMFWGEWRHNQMHGIGRYYYASGQRFEGMFVASKRNGKGKLQKTDGTIDIHQYINDERVGQGVRWSADRSKAWRIWMPAGRGTGQIGNVCVMEKQRISVAEAVSLNYEIDQAVASATADLAVPAPPHENGPPQEIL